MRKLKAELAPKFLSENYSTRFFAFEISKKEKFTVDNQTKKGTFAPSKEKSKWLGWD